jgi:hypothetical protein
MIPFCNDRKLEANIQTGTGLAPSFQLLALNFQLCP